MGFSGERGKERMVCMNGGEEAVDKDVLNGCHIVFHLKVSHLIHFSFSFIYFSTFEIHRLGETVHILS